MEENIISHGTKSYGSMRGVSGHTHNPFAGFIIGKSFEIILSYSYSFTSFFDTYIFFSDFRGATRRNPWGSEGVLFGLQRKFPCGDRVIGDEPTSSEYGYPSHGPAMESEER